MKLIFFFILISICTSCRWSDSDIIKRHWKYNGGYGGINEDWIDFENGSLKILNDTIYKNGIKVAVVIDFNNRISDKELIIKAINSPDTGYFVSK